MAKVEIGNKTFVVDGTDIADAVRGYTLSYDARTRRHELALTPLVEHFAFDGVAEIGIPSRTAKALVALGWTPPPSP
jgi:hypothetical protein